jgi:membrane associated rhomboid family serine protease
VKTRQNLEIVTIIVAILWLVHIVNLALPFDLRLYGLRPQHLGSLWGILISPFLHADFRHLIANTGALFVLLYVSLSFNRKLTFKALVIIILVGGVLVWLFGKRHTIHIGASGVIFGLIGFLMFLGLFRREWTAVLISVVISILYGGALLSLLIYIPGISWTGHFFGFLSGVLAAWLTKNRRI